MKKEERLAIRAAISRFYDDGGEAEIGRWLTFNSCNAIRLRDGRVFVIQDGRIFSGKKPDGRPFWDDEIEKIVLTEEDLMEAMRIPCPQCHVFKGCLQLDDIVRNFKERYGCPKSVETVEAIHAHFLNKKNGLSTTETAEKKTCAEKQNQLIKKEIKLKLASYIIECPFCGAGLEIPGEVNNTTANCPACNEEIYLTKEDAIEERSSKRKGSYRFECPFCQVRLEVPAELDNTTTNCPVCNEEIYLTKEDAIN